MNTDEILNRGLPKWPHVIIQGKSVTIEQAKDIIFRTDRFLTGFGSYNGGNHRKFNEFYRRKCGIDVIEGIDWDDFEDIYQVEHEVHETLDVVELEYIKNDWASCSFIGGPHGFCSPTGNIHFSGNVGKYPDLQQILDDLKAIAKAWPFLEFKANVYSGEQSEENVHVVAGFKVKNGEVEVVDEDFGFREGFDPEFVMKRFTEHMFNNLNNNSSNEIGLPADWYEEFSSRIYSEIKKLVMNKKRFDLE